VFKTFTNAWKVPEMRQKLLFTLLVIVLYRIGAVIPVPFIDFETFRTGGFDNGGMFTYLNLLSGGAMEQGTLFALGVSPYITSSIVIQLLTVAIPLFERWQKSGEEGQKKLTALTRIITVVLAFVTAWGYCMIMSESFNSFADKGNFKYFVYAVVIFCYAAGASMVMWLAEKINDRGIGNGISIILFANIIASTVSTVYRLVVNALNNSWALVLTVIIVYCALAMLIFVVWVTNSERRLAVKYAKRVVGNKMMGGQGSTLPIKLNMSGVMPIIFANSIVSLPATFQMIFSKALSEGKDTFWGKFWNNFFEVTGYTSPLYAIVFFVLIIAFSYFYIMISFNPVEVANNLKNNGGFIPGIRPGDPTANYITKILNRVTLIGAIFLGIVAVVPLIFNMIAGALASNGIGYDTQIGSLAFGGSSLLILVGVILETIRELDAQLAMRHYKGGFLD